MKSLRKWIFKPKKSDQSLLARFYFADEELNNITSELDSFDGRKDPERCATLVGKLRQKQDAVLQVIEVLMNEIIAEKRAPREYRTKFPDDILHESLAGQLWFGAECLAAGSSILNREVESASMRPIARALVKHLDQVRCLLREIVLQHTPLPLKTNHSLQKSLIEFDKLFSEFELSYVSAMVTVKSLKEYDKLQDITVLFCLTVDSCLKGGLLQQDLLDSCDPVLMFTIPRLAILFGLLVYPESALNPDQDPLEMSLMFRQCQINLFKIRELLRVLDGSELHLLKQMLCNDFIHTVKPDDQQLTDDNNDNLGLTRSNSATRLDNMFVIGDEDDDDDAFKEMNDRVEEVKKNITDNNDDIPLGQSICCEGRFNFYLPRNTSIEDYHHYEEFSDKCDDDNGRVDENNLIQNCVASNPCDDNVKNNIKNNSINNNKNHCINNNNDSNNKNNNHLTSTIMTSNESQSNDARKVKSKRQKKTNKRTIIGNDDTNNEKNDRASDEIHKAVLDALEASRKGRRMRYDDQSQLLQQLFIAISGVADHLQSSSATDLRNILKVVFLCCSSSSTSQESSSSSMLSSSESSSSILPSSAPSSPKPTPSPIPSTSHQQVSTSNCISTTTSNNVVASQVIHNNVKPSGDVHNERYSDDNTISATSSTIYNAERSSSNREIKDTMERDQENQIKSKEAERQSPPPQYNQNYLPFGEDSDIEIDRSCVDATLIISERNALQTPPTWLSDQSTSSCMDCNTLFTFFVRRHHCRNCGKIFCHHCSMNKMALPHIGMSKPVRVCNRCMLLRLCHL